MSNYQVDIELQPTEYEIEAVDEKEAVEMAIENLKVDIDLYGWKALLSVYAEELEE